MAKRDSSLTRPRFRPGEILELTEADNFGKRVRVVGFDPRDGRYRVEGIDCLIWAHNGATGESLGQVKGCDPYESQLRKVSLPPNDPALMRAFERFMRAVVQVEGGAQ